MSLNKGHFLDRIAAGRGTVVVNDTTEYVANCYGYFFPEDTVVARIEINEDTATDVKANYITTAATAIKAGVTLTALGDDYFSAITLTSGSCVALLIEA